jgi:hypothetical protein
MTTSSSRRLINVSRTTYGNALMCLTVPGLQFLGFLKKQLADEDKYGALVE